MSIPSGGHFHGIGGICKRWFFLKLLSLDSKHLSYEYSAVSQFCCLMCMVLRTMCSSFLLPWVLLSTKKNQNRCNQTRFLGSVWAKNAGALPPAWGAHSAPQTPSGRFVAGKGGTGGEGKVEGWRKGEGMRRGGEGKECQGAGVGGGWRPWHRLFTDNSTYGCCFVSEGNVGKQACWLAASCSFRWSKQQTQTKQTNSLSHVWSSHQKTR